MTDTFTLTGRILDKSTAPVARARLVLSSIPTTLRDPATNEVYAPPPRVTTDDDGYLCIADASGVPSDTPGVELVVGVQYRLRSVNRALIDEVVFTAPDAGTTLDYADIASEPVDLPDTYADDIAALGAADTAETARATAAEESLADDLADEVTRATDAETDLAADIAGKAAAIHTHVSGDVTNFTEAVQDAVAAMLTSGANVTLTYDDNAGTLQVTAAGGDAEVMRDTIGAALVGTGGVSVAVNDGADTITFSISGLTISQVTNLQTTLDEKASIAATLNAQTGTTYTLVASDADKVVTLTNAAGITVTIPSNATAPIPVGSKIEVHQLGAGQVTFVAGSGATLRSRGGALKMFGQYGVAALRKIATDEFVLVGDLTL